MNWFNVFSVLLICGALMPFLWQPLKKFVSFAGNLAFVVTLMLDGTLALVVLWCYKALSLQTWIAASIIVFVTSRTVYDHVISRIGFLRNRSSL